MDRFQVLTEARGHPDIIYFIISLTLILSFTYLFYTFLTRKRKSISEATSSSGLFVACAETEFNLKFKTILVQQIGDYQSPWWYSPHLGTMIPFGVDHSLSFEREILYHEDGACNAIDWYPCKPPTSHAPQNDAKKICLFLPCLGGNSDHKFAMNFALAISSKEYYTAIVTTRGIGEPLRTKIAWHPAFTDDAYLTMQHVYKSYGPNSKIFFAGFSAGSNIVLQTLLRNQKDKNPIPVAGACCVCFVANYLKVRNELENSALGRVYSFLMANKQKEIIKNNAHAFDDHAEEVARLMKCTYLSEFDSAAMNLVYGFANEEELNRNFSCMGIAELPTPYIGIQPRDDPLFLGKVRENIPYQYLSRNKNFIYIEPSAGNHFGFYEGDLFEAFSNKTSYTWPAKCAILFFESLLENSS